MPHTTTTTTTTTANNDNANSENNNNNDDDNDNDWTEHVDPESGKPTRIKYEFKDGVKRRLSVSSGSLLDKWFGVHYGYSFAGKI